MRIIFMGTPQLAADVLSGLVKHSDIDVCCVVTNEDSKSKRGNKLIPSPVKLVAEECNIDYITPKKLDEDTVTYLNKYQPDFVCVAAYGKLLPKSVLEMPKYECLNVHGSLLPKWRGAAPIQRAILAGDDKVGVSIMRMEAGLDTGDYCIQKAVDVDDKTLDHIQAEMAMAGSEGLYDAMISIVGGRINWVAQEEELVTYADKLDKSELVLSLEDDVCKAQRKVQSSDSSHPCKCIIGNKTVTIVQAKAVKSGDVSAGDVKVFNKKLFLGFKDGMLQIEKVKPDGKKLMDGFSFSSGLQGLKNNGVRWSKTN